MPDLTEPDHDIEGFVERVEEIVRKNREIGGLNYTLKTMETDTVTEWFVNEAYRKFPEEHVGEIFGSEEVEGVVDIVVTQSSEEITEEIERGNSPAEAFNNVTRDWPRESRCVLAEHEAEVRDSDEYENYISDVEAYAQSSDHSIEEVEIPDSLYYDENPHEDSSLTNREASLVVRLRLMGYTGEVVEDVEDVDEFLQRLDQSGDPEFAAIAQNFSGHIPRDVIRTVTDVDTWPNEFNPSDVDIESCAVCTSDYYKVPVAGNILEWVSERGGITGGSDIRESEDLIRHEEMLPPFLCSECYDSLLNEPHSKVSMLCGDAQSAKVSQSNGIGVDLSGGNEDFTHYSDLSEIEKSWMNEMLMHDEPDDYYEISPDAEHGDVTVQSDALRELFNRPKIIDEGPVFVVDHSERHGNIYAYVRRSSGKDVRDVKNHIESYLEPPMVDA